MDGKEITATNSEKLLGVVVNDQLTWKNHLYGDKDREGLIPQLAKRIGMLKRLAKYMSKEKLKSFSSGIFIPSLAIVCLSLETFWHGQIQGRKLQFHSQRQQQPAGLTK